MTGNLFKRCVIGAAMCAALAAGGAHAAPTSRAEAQADAASARPAQRHAKPKLDVSGRTRVGKASYYASKFNGRKMADGTRMDPQGDSAASKTLPLGTTAKVTNLETGESAVVTIRDRGPHVAGRIVDLSPASARKVGIDHHEGVSKVAVTPLDLPPAADEATRPPDAEARHAKAHRDPTPTSR